MLGDQQDWSEDSVLVVDGHTPEGHHPGIQGEARLTGRHQRHHLRNEGYGGPRVRVLVPRGHHDQPSHRRVRHHHHSRSGDLI